MATNSNCSYQCTVLYDVGGGLHNIPISIYVWEDRSGNRKGYSRDVYSTWDCSGAYGCVETADKN